MDIEELHRVVVQGFASVTDRFDSVDARFATVDAGLANLDARLAAVEAKVDAVQGQMNAEFGRVKDALMEHGRQLKDIRVALDRMVDRDELEARH